MTNRKCCPGPSVINMPGQALPAICSASPEEIPWENPPGSPACIPPSENLADILEWLTLEAGKMVCEGITCAQLSPLIDPASPRACWSKGTAAPAFVFSLDADGVIQWRPPVDETPFKGSRTVTAILTEGATGKGHTEAKVDVIVSPDAGNVLRINPTGLYVPEIPLTVNDTNTVNLTEGGAGQGHTGIKADVIISPDTGNIITARTNGLFVPTPPPLTCSAVKNVLEGAACIPVGTIVDNIGFDAAGKIIKMAPPAETPITGDTTPTAILTPGTDSVGHELVKVDVRVSATPDNILTIETDGLYVPPVDCAAVKSALEGAACIPLGTITENVGFNATGGLIKMAPVAFVETPVTVEDTETINMTEGASGLGHSGIKADVIIDPDPANLISLTTTNGLMASITCDAVKKVLEDGGCIIDGTIAKNIGFNAAGKLIQMAPVAFVETTLTGNTTPTAILTPGVDAVGHKLVTVDVRVSATPDNILTIETDGLYVPPVDCAAVKSALEGAACIPLGTITENVGFNAAGNLIRMAPVAAAETPITVIDTTTINMTAGTAASNGHAGIKADVIIDPSPTNLISLTTTNGLLATITCAAVKTALEGGCIPDGAIAKNVGFNATGQLVKAAPTAAAETPVTVLDTTTINMTEGAAGNGHTGIKAEVIIDPTVVNVAAVAAIPATTTKNAVPAEPAYSYVDNLISLTTTNGIVASCNSLKNMLEKGACIPKVAPPTMWQDEADEIQYAFGLKADGTLVKQKRRPLVRITAEGDARPNPRIVSGDGGATAPGNTSTPIFYDTGDNRPIHKWVTGFVGGYGGDNSFIAGGTVPPQPNTAGAPANALDIGSQFVDITSTSLKINSGFTEFVVQHDGYYEVCACVYVRLKMAAAEAVTGKAFSIISAFVFDGNYNRSGTTTGGGNKTEQRFGEDTFDINAASATSVISSGYDVVHAGCVMFYLAKGTKVWVRSWVGGGSAASRSTPIELSFVPATGATFSIKELARDMF